MNGFNIKYNIIYVLVTFLTVFSFIGEFMLLRGFRGIEMTLYIVMSISI